MAIKDWKKGTIVKAKTNINTEIGRIEKGTVGKITKHMIAFGSNADIWYIKFRGYDETEFSNYDKRFIGIIK